jgi:sulfate transport system permease protein
MIMSILLPASACWIRFMSAFNSLAALFVPASLALSSPALVRYSFFGKRFHALIDFALPTAVAGIVLAIIFQPSGFSEIADDSFGIQAAFKTAGIVMALILSASRRVRTVEPVLLEFELAMKKLHRAWRHTLQVFAKLFSECRFCDGFALACQGVGEYGSSFYCNIPYARYRAAVDCPSWSRILRATAIALTMLEICLCCCC